MLNLATIKVSVTATASTLLSGPVSAWRLIMGKSIDLTGKTFGRLTVVELNHQGERYVKYYRCVCKCGKSVVVMGSSLTFGRTQSCGCLHSENAKARMFRHGGSGTREYSIWAGIKSRCSPDGPYGLHGIKMCAEWADSFGAFLAHIGPSPSPLHSVDRIKNELGYQPGNVRWATDAEQSKNKTSNRLIVKDGVTRNLTEWAEVLGINPATIYARINAGWAEDRLLIPVGAGPCRDGYFVHGESLTPEYAAWMGMKKRDGDLVCAEWRDDYAAFKAVVGARPSDKHVISRVDGTKPWAPGNVEWITKQAKQRQLAVARVEVLDGVAKTVSEWAENFGIERRRLAQRLRQGWQLKEALETPFAARHATSQ